jgi:isopentenyl diphosphate isomerase/L-lactate dehydrogenase-like FMN-dependent dehydrogenase
MNPVNLFDMEAMAKQRLHHDYWDWIEGGSADEITIRRNREAFEEISVRPRVLVDTAGRDLSTTMLGQPISFPVFASPVGTLWLTHPDGEVGVARAASDVGTLMAVASGAHNTLEEVAAATSGPRWFQLYHFTDEVTEYIVPRAEALGYSAICLTVGGAGGRGGKERDARNNYRPSNDLGWGDLKDLPHLREQVSRFIIRGLTWDRLEWLRSLSKLPLVVKEILTPEDARRCVDHGASAIVVSNHGGRSFDMEQATIEALPAIVGEVGDEIEVYLDSGVRRGTDVLKALALGARAVGVGRPLFWGLATDGEAGVRTMFEMLRDELSRAMAICGCLSVDDIDESLVVLPNRR